MSRGTKGPRSGGPGFKVLLASGSPRRKEILTQIGVPFEVVAQTAEELSGGLPARKLAHENARRKARSAVLPGDPAIGVVHTKSGARVGNSTRSLKDVVVGVDTIVVSGGVVLGKPHDVRESRAMIEALSGKTHEVISAIHLWMPGRGSRSVSLAASTAVTFRRLTAAEVRWYVETGEGRDKAGAYGIQGFGAVLVDRIDGDYFNVVGFPVRTFLRGLARLGLPYPGR